jgi:hypothetical protein
MHSVVGPCQPLLELDVEVLRRGERPSRQERGVELAVGPLHQALASGSPGMTITTLIPSVISSGLTHADIGI